MKIDVRHDLGQLANTLDERVRKQIPFATAQALTMTALRVKDELTREMNTAFSLPVAYTLRAIRTQPATKADLRATVYVNSQSEGGTPQLKYFSANIAGGGRGAKPFENALRSVAALPVGMVAVPGSAANVDSNGNMSRAQINEIPERDREPGEEG